MTIENIKELMDGVDIATLLPKLDKLTDFAAFLAHWSVLVGPIVLLILGLHYFLLAPKEANYTTGYRFRWGMASVESWRFMQQVAGVMWTLLGLGLLIAMSIANTQSGDLEVMDLLWLTVQRLAMQAVLALCSCVLIDLAVFVRYDRKGIRRLTWRELYKG